jgi:uncharacterized integral membrane protein (TIGR00697 family)
MSNELIFVGATLLDLLLILLATKYGKNWLFLLIAANLIMVQVLAVKNVEVFGFIASAAAIFYAAIFIATDILTEHWGKAEGYKSIKYAFVAIVFVIGFGYLGRMFVPVDPNAATGAFDILFNAIPRITIASLVAYLVAQNLDIWLYQFIREKTGGKHLWLRNNGSTLVSQFVDSVLFFTIAFFGTVPFIVSLILTGYFAKLIIALVDTPFIYLSYWIQGKPLPRPRRPSARPQ